MTTSSRSELWGPARVAFIAAMLHFLATIVIGILNGIDVWEPEHDVLVTHVHAGALGWITLGTVGVILLIFSTDRDVSPPERRRVNALTWSMVAAVTVYVLAFLVGDAIFDDRIQRPVVGTGLLLVTIWFLTWLSRAYRQYRSRRPARLGLLLAWVSLIVGSVLGVILGLYASAGEVPGLSGELAARTAEAHPPSMLIGYTLLAAFATVEWLLHRDKRDTRNPTAQMWLLFVAGMTINVAFITGTDDVLAGPANALMIAAAGMLLWRSRAELAPGGWPGSGVKAYPRTAVLGLVLGLGLLTVLIYWFITDQIVANALTESQAGLVFSFDHVMFIGVMSNVIIGVMAINLPAERSKVFDQILLWGMNIGLLGFAIGLITTSQVMKRIFTPVLGLSLLVGLCFYLVVLWSAKSSPAAIASGQTPSE